MAVSVLAVINISSLRDSVGRVHFCCYKHIIPPGFFVCYLCFVLIFLATLHS